MKNPLTEIKSTWQSIPAEVQQFLKRALLIFIIWKLIYHLFLFNGRIIDKPLTYWNAKGTLSALQQIYPEKKMNLGIQCISMPETLNEVECLDIVVIDGKKVVGVGDGCNALELMILYLGFLISFPSTMNRRIWFSVFGLAIIYFINIVRLTALAEMYLHHLSSAELAHHYTFKITEYAVIFVLWIFYTKKVK